MSRFGFPSAQQASTPGCALKERLGYSGSCGLAFLGQISIMTPLMLFCRTDPNGRFPPTVPYRWAHGLWVRSISVFYQVQSRASKPCCYAKRASFRLGSIHGSPILQKSVLGSANEIQLHDGRINGDRRAHV